MTIDRAQRCHRLDTRPNPDVRTDRDGGIVHEEPVGVDERIHSEPNVVAIAAVKPRHYQRSLTHLAEKARYVSRQVRQWRSVDL